MRRDNHETDDDIAEARRGDSRAYGRLMRRFGQQVFALVVRLTGDAFEAEELTQDCFVKAFSAIRSYDSGKALFTTWLMRIAYNETMNHLRKKRLPTISYDELPADGDETSYPLPAEPGPDEDYQEPQARIIALERCIELLPADDRALLILYYFDGLPIQEIAVIMDANPATLATRLHRTRNRLRRMMENDKLTSNISHDETTGHIH